MRIVFMGSPDFAVPTLKRLAREHEIVAVYTQPPRPAGRGKKERPTPVARTARGLGLPVRWPASLRGAEERAALAALAPDVIVVVAYGLILPRAVLEIPRHGCFNLHASLLPRWRGAAPIQRAIMAGDEVSGVCVMRMDAGLDSGEVCGCVEVPIDDATTAGALHDTLAERGAALMAAAMAELERTGTLDCLPQPGVGVTYAEKIDKAEARIDFSRPARAVLRHVHGLSPHPGAWMWLARPEDPAKRVRVRMLKAELAPEAARSDAVAGEIMDEDFTIACGEGAIRPILLQREGKAPVSREAFLRGFPVKPGTRLPLPDDSSDEEKAASRCRDTP